MTRTPETIDAYRRRALALTKQATAELCADRLNIFQVIAWFLSHHRTWAPATVRQYRAALTQLVADAIASGELDRLQGASLAEKLRGRIDPNGHQIAPRAGALSPRPKKRRHLSPAQAKKLVQQLRKRHTKTAHLGQLIVAAGLEIGVRPCEWIAIEVHNGVCQVRNAKNTNDRANGEIRLISILADQQGSELLAIVSEIQKKIPQGVSWKKFQRRLNYLLKRGSRDIGLTTPVSLSTLRHVAIGRWKCAFGPDEVAALAGHASNATAVCHYGRRRSGRKWTPTLVRPSAPTFAIRDRFYAYGCRPSALKII